jgi:inward rectifier potassium channel
VTLSRPAQRSGGVGGGVDVLKYGVPRRPLQDLYYFLLTSPWWVLFALILLVYLTTNALFATVYVLDGGIENARPGSFRDAYFFSVQTMATIGYGKMVPESTLSNIVVTLEALFGLVTLALATGLMFAKFSQPRARVIWSRNAVITSRDGVRSLIVRLANERSTGLVEAQLRLVLLREEVTAEGESIRRFHSLPLARSSTAVFALSWTAIHPIDSASPLYGATNDSLRAGNALIVASLLGLEEATAQTVHARHTWTADQVLIDHRFRDIFAFNPAGVRTVDYALFHDVEPVGDAPAREPPEGAPSGSEPGDVPQK